MERVLWILYIAHKDSIKAMRTQFPRISLDAYRTNGTFTLANPEPRGTRSRVSPRARQTHRRPETPR